MHIRITKVKSSGKTYRYAQLVESYRRDKDRMPATRVLANLGKLSDTEISNLRLAIAASREGKQVVLSSVAATPAKPQANLQYLDVAVLLELWRRHGIDRLCNQLLPRGEATVTPADVIAALAIHRCVDPGSKLHATRWFSRTALPELLDVPSDAFGNSRLHRVLELLTEQTGAMMRSLPSLCRRGSSDSFSALYVDISDATFEGAGPELARRGRAKRDFITQRVGVVLLCNERGYPLRWDVIAGNAPEAPALIEQMRLAASTTWGKRVPVVADRAIGRTAYLRELLTADVHFVTAMTRNEFAVYAPELNKLAAETADACGDDDITTFLEEHGFTRVNNTLLFRDLGVVEREETTQSEQQATDLSSGDTTKDALQYARRIAEAVSSGAAASRNEAIKKLGYQQGTAKGWCKLLRLTNTLQEHILNGASAGLPLRRVTKLSGLEPDSQQAAFDELVALRDAGKLRKLPQKTNRNLDKGDTAAVRVRAAVYFNPEIFQHQRTKAQQQLDETYVFVEQLNSRVSSSQSQTDLANAIAKKLRQLGLTRAFDVSTRTAKVDGRPVPQVHLKLKEGEWKRRRALDGFSLLVAHPKVPLSALELCRLYRSKDTIEKDFQTIKSVLRMLPVRHRRDEKVFAHVTLCVLALLLERLLRDDLSGLMSPEKALETLATCHLNRYGDKANSRAYLITQPDDAQTEILRTLKLTHLTSDVQMIEAIHSK